jgi:hypothetical protein
MARLNLTIPDPLYERLEQMRERVNVSKVCARALEKELDMLEGQTTIAAPRVARLAERLQTTRGHEYKRGYEGGTAWALDHARRADLQTALDLAEYDGKTLALVYEANQDLQQARLSDKAEVAAVRERWAEVIDLPQVPGRVIGESPLESSTDMAAYLEGWRDALTDLWKAIAPSLA